MSPDEQILILERRDEAWKKLVRYLIEEDGFAPPFGARGLWVDLYDEVTMAAQRDGPGPISEEGRTDG